MNTAMFRVLLPIVIGLSILMMPLAAFSVPWSPLTAIEAIDPSPPLQPMRLIFIHHSTGENWLVDDNGGLGLALRDNNYFVSDTNYGWGPAYQDGGGGTIGDHTDIMDWYSWFTGPHRDTYLAALYPESDQHSSYSRLPTNPGGPNTIIMFKSCFPNSNIYGNPDDPPAASADNTSDLNGANAKRIYLDALNYFAAHQDKLFVVITAPPLMAGDTTPELAANARAFNNWLVDDWLSNYPHANVAVFDFYAVLTTNGGDPDTNDLGALTGNHHRYRNGVIEHITNQGDNTSAYPTGDSHPSQAGNLKATGEFVSLLNIFYHRWQGAGQPDLSTSAKQANTGQVQPGDRVTYTIALRNTGDPFSNTIRVTDVVPFGLNYLPGSFTATTGSTDASAAPTLTWNGVMSNTSIVTLTFAVTVATSLNQTITNVATIDPAIDVPITRSAAVTVTAPQPNLSTSTKQATTANAIFGNTVTYTIALRNTGTPFSSTMYLTDVVPAGLTYLPGSLSATRGAIDASSAPTLKWTGDMSGTSAITITYAVTVATKVGQTIVNVATINPVVLPTFTRSASLSIANAPPDLSASTKQVSNATAIFGDVLTYTIALRNTGGPFTHTVRVTDTVPIGLNYITGSFTATRGTVDASAAPTLKWGGVMSSTPVITLTYKASVAVKTAQTITNVALINPAAVPAFTRSAAVMILNVPPDLSSSTKGVSQAAAMVGDTLTYTIVLRNTGGISASLKVTDVVPSGLSYISGTLIASSGVVSQSLAPTLRWSGWVSPTLPVTIAYAVSVTINTPGAIINTATIVVSGTQPINRSATIIVNGYSVFLPTILKD